MELKRGRVVITKWGPSLLGRYFWKIEGTGRVYASVGSPLMGFAWTEDGAYKKANRSMDRLMRNEEKRRRNDRGAKVIRL